MKALLYFALLVCILKQVNTQPFRKTDWRILGNDANPSGYTYPRVASFSSGNYAIIFGYSAPNNISGTRMLRLNVTTGTSYEAGFEIESSGDLSDPPLTAQNVFVFPDNSAYAVWQTAGTAKTVGAQFMEFGGLVSNVFYNADPGNWNLADYVDIVGSSWEHFTVAFSSPLLSRIFFTEPLYGTQRATTFSAQSIHSAVGTTLVYGYPAIYTLVTYSGFAFGLNQTFVNTTSLTSGYVTNCANGIPFVMDDLGVVGALFVTSVGEIQLLVFSIPDLVQLYSFKVVSSRADPAFIPSVTNISSNVVLIAYSSSDNRINYQMVKLSRTSAVLVGPQVTHDAAMTTLSVSMANTIGSDIVVVAKDVTGTQVMSRTITFCGNNALDLKEECDGAQGCTSDCKCQMGTIAINGACVDQCQNGIVTGQEQCDSGTGCVECKCASGYRPTTPRSKSCEIVPKEFVPNVKPQFDCLDVSPNGYTLHFSYINNDGFDETVSYGALNSFTPASLGANRPSIFNAGQSLTYPLSPYSVDVPSDTQSVTWILTSYNIVVDLTNTSPLQCPKDLSLTLTVSTSGNLTDTLVQKLLQNIALKYNISESRLSANYTLVSTDAQGLNEYVIVVTIGDAPNLTEKPSTEVVKDILDDLQNSKNNLNSDLTQGLEEVNPVIKDVTPAIVQTRGQVTPNSGFTPVAVEPIISNISAKVTSLSWSLVVVLLLFVY